MIGKATLTPITHAVLSRNCRADIQYLTQNAPHARSQIEKRQIIVDNPQRFLGLGGLSLSQNELDRMYEHDFTFKEYAEK